MTRAPGAASNATAFLPKVPRNAASPRTVTRGAATRGPDRHTTCSEAKRKAIEAWQGYESAAATNRENGLGETDAVLRAQGARHAVRILAQPHADHPDFDPAWRL